jgi:hypothetical protein
MPSVPPLPVMDLLRQPTPLFVAEAWRMVLGRDSDARGYGAALDRLDAGGSRRALLKRLALSEEAQLRGTPPAWTPSMLDSAWVDRSLRLIGAPRAALSSKRRQAQRLRRLPTLRSFQGRTAGHPPEPDPKSPGSPKRIAFFTIIARNYLPQARVLMRSVAARHPEVDRIVVVVDDDGQRQGDNFETLAAERLGIDSFDDMTVRYDVLELSTAVKPFVFRSLLRRPGLDHIVYLDPDIELFGRLDSALALLEAGAPIVLTPHTTAPVPGPGLPNDHSFLQCGVFNLGFIALRRGEASERWLGWWGEQLLTRSVVDFANNLFTDQRWCDLAPCYVDGLAVLRDPGFNVAYWNIEQRPLGRNADGHWTAGGSPLGFFHFSGFDPARPEQVSRHQTRLSDAVARELQPLLQHYSEGLRCSGWPEAGQTRYGHDHIDDEGRLGALLRRFYRMRWPLPQQQSRQALLKSLLEAAWPAAAGGLPPLVEFLHHSDAELRTAFDLGKPRDRAALWSWFLHTVVPRQELDTLFTPESLADARATP